MENKVPKRSEFFFRGNSNVLTPHRTTRYIYPSYLSFPKFCLLLQAPVNASKRSGPVGRASYGSRRSDFLTLTRSGRPPPTKAQFDAWVAAEKSKDKTSKNPLGRAMRRMSGYQGNTVLESGKFRLKKTAPLMYIEERKTSILLEGGGFAFDRDVYEIECSK
jgi:hypothetical protein